MINKEIKSLIKEQSLREIPNECCGLILNINNELKVFPCKNISLNPEHNFEIDTKEYLAAALTGDITACYHSHCGEITNFSIFDKANSNNHNLIYILYSCSDNNFLIYIPNSDLDKYTGREFKINSNDCLSLARDYYKKELNINIGNYNYGENWIKNSTNFFDTEYEKEGFAKISDGYSDKIKKHDICFIKHLKDFPHATHILVYLGGNLVLHHKRGGNSVVENYDDSLKRKTMMIVRHKNLC